MNRSQSTVGILHVSTELGSGNTLGGARLSDRGRIALILQASALLSHLEAADSRLDSDWQDLRIDESGVLCGARVVSGPDSVPAQSRLVELTRLVFAVQGGRLAGKGQAKRWAAGSLARWGRVHGRLPANRIVTEMLDDLDFLWHRQFAGGRRALIAEIRSAEGSRIHVAGRGSFGMGLRNLGSDRGSLETVVETPDSKSLWKACQNRALRIHPADGKLALARGLSFRGLDHEALNAVSSCHDFSAELIRAKSLRSLGRHVAAKNVIEKLPDPPSAVEPVLLEYLEVALAVYLDLGEVSTASKLLESCGGCLSRPGRVVIKLLSAEIAARSGEWQKVGRLLGSIEDLELPSAWLWKVARLSMGLARSQGDLCKARHQASLAIASCRRTVPLRQAASMWRDLASIRLEQGDLQGASRAGRHALRLWESMKDGAAEGAHRMLTDLLLRQGKWQVINGMPESEDPYLEPSRLGEGPTARELAVRADLLCGRPAEALRRAREALAGSDSDEGGRLRVLAARALGWLGRGADARELLDSEEKSIGGVLEPEEYPALWALAGDWLRARELAQDDAIGRIWRAVLERNTTDSPCWSALRELESYRAARLVFDIQVLSPAVVPALWLGRAVEVLRSIGAHSFAERLDRTTTGAWKALETFLRAPATSRRDFAHLFSEAGYFDAHLEWRHPEGTQVLVSGNGGTDQMKAETKGGELVLSAGSMDASIRALFALAVRDFEPDVEHKGRPSSRVRGILGNSESLREALIRLERLAESDVPILIQGESGTGKELAARQVHHLSARSSHPLVPVNCAALSESLLLSDLFGHVRGAFTGADRDRAGVFESARGGTVMLDEIGDLPLAAQGKLLRVLQEGEVRRVGESLPRRVDIRIVAATHRDLKAMVDEQTFREDLYYRLNVGSLTLPPLRNRGEDVLLLADHFTERSGCKLTSRARDALMGHSWPGNVRELRNVLQVAMVMSRKPRVDLQDLELPGSHRDPRLGYHQQVDQFRRKLVSKALAASDGRRAVAARQLGVSRQAVSYLIRRFGLQ